MDIFTQVMAQNGLIWMVGALLLAGLVRGFTGFGTAMIFVPVGAQFLPMPQVIALMALTGLATMGALLPRAWGYASKSEVIPMSIAAAVAAPIALSMLAVIDQTTLRWGVAAITSITLISMVSGWQLRWKPSTFGHVAVGAGAGCVGGLTGLTGPVVIVFYLATAATAAQVRANIIVVLAALDVALIVATALTSVFTAHLLALGAILSVPYVLATSIGQALFDPARERIYRILAHSTVALVVITSLPLFDG